MLKTTFTLAEAAQLLSCHKETLRRAIKDGSLSAARVGREYRFSRIDLQAYWTNTGGGELFGAETELTQHAEPKPGRRTNPRNTESQQFTLFPLEENKE